MSRDPIAELHAASLLRLLWLASPALPVGAFSHSEGLEAAVEAGLADDEASAGRWLVDQLHLGVGRCELPLVAAAFRAWEPADPARIEALNGWALAVRESAELHLQTVQSGRSLTEWLRGQSADDTRIGLLRALRPAPAWPIALALALRRSGAPLQACLLACAFGWAENMVQTAIRVVPLGQSAGQRLLGALADAIPSVVDEALARDDDDRQAFLPMLAIQSSRHETQYSRLFRS